MKEKSIKNCIKNSIFYIAMTFILFSPIFIILLALLSKIFFKMYVIESIMFIITPFYLIIFICCGICAPESPHVPKLPSKCPYCGNYGAVITWDHINRT